MTECLRGDGLRWRSGPFIIHAIADAPGLVEPMRRLYAYHEILTTPYRDVADFHLELARGQWLRRWFRPTIHFLPTGRASGSPMAPFPLDHALPLLEWGQNWCIASRANHYLMLHAGVVAKKGKALLLPGTPGSGKSTLAAALSLSGWQLLSDEFALLHPYSGRLHPLARPVALKNESIQAVRDFSNKAVIGPEFPKTRKGTVAHLRPPKESVDLVDRVIDPVCVVRPVFKAAAPTTVQPLPKDNGFLILARNAFNFEMQGKRGFRAVERVIGKCDSFEMVFGQLDEAVAALEEIFASSVKKDCGSPLR
ncbi:MAG: HprK-related kinase A [Magnetococcales bacterium]|nr:HprK-related kinase A [Magnetococcales bacterium]